MPRRFKPPKPDQQRSGPFQPIQLPTHLNLIVYPRQSTQIQVIRNIGSTEMQTDDLIAIGVRYGWSREQCIVIDDDLGVSGTLNIDEREGLMKVMEQIDHLQSRAVLVVNEDRLFRDETMIQVNVFIKFMRDHNAYVLTPHMVYNFQERFHVKMFREKAEYAAAYITDYIRERLIAARMLKAGKGMYDGRFITPGYLVDYERKRPDGSENPTFQKYVVYEPHAEIVRQIAQVCLDREFSLTELYRHCLDNGLIFPNWEPWVDPKNRARSALAPVMGGLFYQSIYGLQSMLTNPTYAGHWMSGGQIAQRNNHPAILAEATFMQLFNRLSHEDMNGEVNTRRPRKLNYPPQKVWRTAEDDGMLLGLLYDLTKDFPRPVTYCYHGTDKRQPELTYLARDDERGMRKTAWTIPASVLDEAVSAAFLERLRRSKVDYDPEVYAQQATRRLKEVETRVKILEACLVEIQEKIEGSLRAMMLRGLSDDEMAFFLSQKRSLEKEKYEIEIQLQTTRDSLTEAHDSTQVFKTLDELLDNWLRLTARQRRRYLGKFTQMIGVKRGDGRWCELWIYWKSTLDESLDAAEIEILSVRLKRSRESTWTEEDYAYLREHYGDSQVEIMQHFPTRTWLAILRIMNRLGLDRRARLVAQGQWPAILTVPDHLSYQDWLAKPDPIASARPARRDYRYWSAEEDAALQETCELERLEIMKCVPDRSWSAILRRFHDLGISRRDILTAQQRFGAQNYGKSMHMRDGITYNEYLALLNAHTATPEPSEPFTIDILVDNLSNKSE
jgi:hypothetical protein